MNNNDMAPPGYRVYPGSVPEFRLFQKTDGTIEQHVRYINASVGYTGKWMKVNIVREEENGSSNNTNA